jgi:tol-pal system protein YbgF
MNKLQTQIVDLGNTVKTLQSPPAPPSPTGAAGSTAPPPGLSAKQLYDTAMKDRSGGNLDLAMQGFQEYLKYFGDTELAPNAQFYIGQIHYDKNDFPKAIAAFDMVLERFPENSKTPDAMYMKGMALLKSTQRTEAAKEFQSLIQKYPNAEVSSKARQQRKALG